MVFVQIMRSNGVEEAAAREGEHKELPAELQPAMAESPDSMGTTEFLDLIDALVL